MIPTLAELLTPDQVEEVPRVAPDSGGGHVLVRNAVARDRFAARLPGGRRTQASLPRRSSTGLPGHRLTFHGAPAV
jgi:hypothetical protein